MFGSNPYAQAGWFNPQNSQSINNCPWRPNSSLPPTFGMLPSPQSNPASVLTFQFTSMNPDMYNCVVIGPKQLKYFEVRTNSNITTISKPGKPFALIGWSQSPTVEAPGILPLQRTRDFLKLAADKTYRTMMIGGRAYAWIPRSDGINLYSYGPSPPEHYARIRVSSSSPNIILEITSESFQAGLFEPCIISALLLLSQKNID